MTFSLPSTIFILVALIVSVVVAIFALKMWDETRAEISVRKIIGSTKEQQKRDDLFYPSSSVLVLIKMKPKRNWSLRGSIVTSSLKLTIYLK